MDDWWPLLAATCWNRRKFGSGTRRPWASKARNRPRAYDLQKRTRFDVEKGDIPSAFSPVTCRSSDPQSSTTESGGAEGVAPTTAGAVDGVQRRRRQQRQAAFPREPPPRAGLYQARPVGQGGRRQRGGRQ